MAEWLFTQLPRVGILGSTLVQPEGVNTVIRMVHSGCATPRWLDKMLLYLYAGKAARAGRPVHLGTARLAIPLWLLVASLVLAVGACAGDVQRQEEPKPRPLPEERQALRPGEYFSEEFEPSLSFRVGEG